MKITIETESLEEASNMIATAIDGEVIRPDPEKTQKESQNARMLEDAMAECRQLEAIVRLCVPFIYRAKEGAKKRHKQDKEDALAIWETMREAGVLPDYDSADDPDPEIGEDVGGRVPGEASCASVEIDTDRPGMDPAKVEFEYEAQERAAIQDAEVSEIVGRLPDDIYGEVKVRTVIARLVDDIGLKDREEIRRVLIAIKDRAACLKHNPAPETRIDTNLDSIDLT